MSCVECGQQTPRRVCKACDIEEHFGSDEPESERTVEVVCSCQDFDGATWDPSRSPYDTHHHDDECDETTRYQAIGNDGDVEPTRPEHQRAKGGAA